MNLIRPSQYACVSYPAAKFSNESKAKMITEISSLTAISPIDGRYARACHPLRAYFSEYALMRFRVYVELYWFQTLFSEGIVCQDKSTIAQILAEKPFMDSIFDSFSTNDGQRVKEIEKTTNHDVKAIEYFLKEKFAQNKVLAQHKEYLHFSCTSADINNLAYGLMLHHSFKDVILPQIRSL